MVKATRNIVIALFFMMLGAGILVFGILPGRWTPNSVSAQDGFVNQPTPEASPDCADPQTGGIVNRPTVVPPVLSEYLKGFTAYEYVHSFAANDKNGANKAANLADELGKADADYKAAGFDMEGRTIWFGFSESQVAADLIGVANVSAKNADWLGVIGTYHRNELPLWGKITAAQVGGGALFVFADGYGVDKVFSEIAPKWYEGRNGTCG